MTRMAWLVGCMLVLASLDMAGALLAQQYADRHLPVTLLLGALTFVVLFIVYTVSLAYAQLSVVTMGWIVLLQVGLIGVDLGRGRLHLDRSQVLAMLAIIVLQCYLIASTQQPVTAAPAAAPATPYLDVQLPVVSDRYGQLAAALPGVRLHYAVKANPAPEVLALLALAGCAFDVASPREIDLCLAAGATPQSLSYGNTAKKLPDIAASFRTGVRVFTFDAMSELDKLSGAAPGATVCCRLTTSGDGADWALSDKFGCRPERALELLTVAGARGHPLGLAFHVGSQQRDPGQWEGPLRTVGILQDQLAARGLRLSLLNIGGGFPTTYRYPVAPVLDYGRSIRAALDRHLREPLPDVIAEPGRYLVADAGVLHCEVVLVAERAGRRWVHLDVGLFGGLAETLEEAIQYRIETDLDGGPDGPVVLAGPTCDSADILYRRADYRLPLALAAGDRLRLLSTGAYTASYSAVAFNGFPPLRVLIHPADAGSLPDLPAQRPRPPWAAPLRVRSLRPLQPDGGGGGI